MHRHLKRGRRRATAKHSRGNDGEARQNELGLDHQRQADTQPDRKNSAARRVFEPATGHSHQGKTHRHSVRGFVRVGRHIVEVGEVERLVERKQRDEQATGRPRSHGAPCAAKNSVSGGDERRDDHEIRDRQNDQPGAENPEQASVEILRKRTVNVVDVPIEDRAFGESPGDMEFPAEVDKGVVPLPPRDAEQKSGEHRQTENAQEFASVSRSPPSTGRSRALSMRG